MGGGAGGQELGPDLLSHQFLILDRETLATPGALSHSDFSLPPAGAGAFSAPPSWPGCGEGLCEECPPAGRGRGGGERGTLTAYDLPRYHSTVFPLSHVICYTQRLLEGDMPVSL